MEGAKMSQNISVGSLFVAIFIKYGLLGIICIYFAYNIREKDEYMKDQTEIIVKMVREQTQATTKSTEVMSALVEAVKEIRYRREFR